MKRKYFSVLFLLLIVCARVLSTDQSVKVMRNLFSHNEKGLDKESITIAIDPGHGGMDPGKVGVNNALEKVINLQIAEKLKSLLEQNDISVVMTRENDKGLYSQSDSNKKRADMAKRLDIINNSGAQLAICIHQNSFSEEYCKGAQVFYHAKSDEGKILAKTVQQQMKESIKDGNHREAKSNESYYLLKNVKCPFVIVECGYLSNHKEAELLIKEDYQEKVAWSIFLGIMKYLNCSAKVN